MRVFGAWRARANPDKPRASRRICPVPPTPRRHGPYSYTVRIILNIFRVVFTLVYGIFFFIVLFGRRRRRHRCLTTRDRIRIGMIIHYIVITHTHMCIVVVMTGIGLAGVGDGVVARRRGGGSRRERKKLKNNKIQTRASRTRIVCAVYTRSKSRVALWCTFYTSCRQPP